MRVLAVDLVDELLGAVGDLLLLALQVIRIATALGVDARVGLLGDQVVHILDQILDPCSFLFNLVAAVLAHQQLQHRLHVDDDFLLALDGVAELILAEDLGQYPELILHPSFLALANRPGEQLGALGIALAEVFGQLQQRLLEAAIPHRDHFLRAGQRSRRYGTGSGGRILCGWSLGRRFLGRSD